MKYVNRILFKMSDFFSSEQMLESVVVEASKNHSWDSFPSLDDFLCFLALLTCGSLLPGAGHSLPLLGSKNTNEGALLQELSALT